MIILNTRALTPSERHYDDDNNIAIISEYVVFS